MARLLDRYNNEAVPKLMERFGLKNRLAVPKVQKIVVNVGAGRAITEAKRLEQAASDLAAISGQKAVITKARKSVSAFKLRQGQPIGAKVTLRGKRMYEFFDRLISIVLPRVRDFRGLPANSFDGQGNYTLGLSDQAVFPEIKVDTIEFQQGMNITICVSGGSDERSRELLRLLGVPLTTEQIEG